MNYRDWSIRIAERVNRFSRQDPKWLTILRVLGMVLFVVPNGLFIVFILDPLKELFGRVFRRSGNVENQDSPQPEPSDEGTPLKPLQRRIVRRDPRLAKKPQDARPDSPLMPSEEARRRFSDTIRSTNRKIATLLADHEQLARYGLPLWETEADLAEGLGISIRELRFFSIHRQADPICHYVTFAIPKRNGKQRLIMAPKRRLKSIQRRLLRELIAKLPMAEPCHGFRPGRSTRTAAGPHVGKSILLKLDLKDFFPSVTYGRVRGLLIALGYGYSVAATIAVLATESERRRVELDGRVVHVPLGRRHCVQGAPTSPALCNAICVKLDRRLVGLAMKCGWEYTRYADDLTFSGNTPQHLQAIMAVARCVCNEEGFAINSEKTRVLRRGRRQTVTGVVVNDVPGLSRHERRKLRAVIHRITHPQAGKPPSLTIAQLCGKLAYLQMLNPSQADALRKRM